MAHESIDPPSNATGPDEHIAEEDLGQLNRICAYLEKRDRIRRRRALLVTAITGVIVLAVGLGWLRHHLDGATSAARPRPDAASGSAASIPPEHPAVVSERERAVSAAPTEPEPSAAVREPRGPSGAAPAFAAATEPEPSATVRAPEPYVTRARAAVAESSSPKRASVATPLRSRHEPSARPRSTEVAPLPARALRPVQLGEPAIARSPTTDPDQPRRAVAAPASLESDIDLVLVGSKGLGGTDIVRTAIEPTRQAVEPGSAVSEVEAP